MRSYVVFHRNLPCVPCPNCHPYGLKSSIRPVPASISVHFSPLSRIQTFSPSKSEEQNQNLSKQPTKMEEDHGNSNSSITVDTTKWDRSVWLMKCPLVVSKSWQSQAAASSSSADSPQVAKVIVSVDPLRSDDSAALQVKLSFISSRIFQPQKNKTNSASIIHPVCNLCVISIFI